MRLILLEFFPSNSNHTAFSDVSTIAGLNPLGSHGPAYYRRYPEAYRLFRPDCRSPNFGDCTNDEISNAYDNTIVYTDHVVSSAVDVLSAYSGIVDSSLIYVSDYSESLGEYNVYLHGMPYRFAPDKQIKVPIVTWLSDGTVKNQRMDRNCEASLNPLSISHDNFFHTELGLMEIKSALYNPAMGIFSSCRADAERSAAGA